MHVARGSASEAFIKQLPLSAFLPQIDGGKKILTKPALAPCSGGGGGGGGPRRVVDGVAQNLTSIDVYVTGAARAFTVEVNPDEKQQRQMPGELLLPTNVREERYGFRTHYTDHLTFDGC
jgi:hypothetical protein